MAKSHELYPLELKSLSSSELVSSTSSSVSSISSPSSESPSSVSSVSSILSPFAEEPSSVSSPSVILSPSKEGANSESFLPELSLQSLTLREKKSASPSPSPYSPTLFPASLSGRHKKSKQEKKMEALHEQLLAEEQLKTLKYSLIKIDDKEFPQFGVQKFNWVNGVRVERNYYNKIMEDLLKNGLLKHYKIIGLDVNGCPLVKLFKTGVKPNAIQAPAPFGWSPSDIIDIETKTVIISLDKLLLKLCPTETTEAIWVVLANKNKACEFRISEGNHFYTAGKNESVYAAGNFKGVKYQDGVITYKITDQTGTYHSTRTDAQGKPILPLYADIFQSVGMNIARFSLFQVEASSKKAPEEEPSQSLSIVKGVR